MIFYFLFTNQRGGKNYFWCNTKPFFYQLLLNATHTIFKNIFFVTWCCNYSYSLAKNYFYRWGNIASQQNMTVFSLLAEKTSSLQEPWNIHHDWKRSEWICDLSILCTVMKYSSDQAQNFLLFLSHRVCAELSFFCVIGFTAHVGLSSFLLHCFHVNSLQHGMSMCHAGLKTQRFQIREPRHVLRRKNKNCLIHA